MRPSVAAKDSKAGIHTGRSEGWPGFFVAIVVNLSECQSAQDVREMVIQVFEYWFNGFTEPFYSDNYFHREIWAIRQRFKVRSA